MSQFRHLRCDRCTDDIVLDPDKVSRSGWAYVYVGVDTYDLCPNCWKLIVDKEELVRGKGRAEHDSGE